MTKLEELLKWMDDAEYAPSYGELREKIKQLITEEQQVKNCDLADVVDSEEGTESDCDCKKYPHVYSYDNKPCCKNCGREWVAS